MILTKSNRLLKITELKRTKCRILTLVALLLPLYRERNNILVTSVSGRNTVMGTGELLVGKKECEENSREGRSDRKLLKKNYLDISVFLSLTKLFLFL